MTKYTFLNKKVGILELTGLKYAMVYCEMRLGVSSIYTFTNLLTVETGVDDGDSELTLRKGLTANTTLGIIACCSHHLKLQNTVNRI